ncbi:MAG: FixH family protein [Planctomycetota bacterium]
MSSREPNDDRQPWWRGVQWPVIVAVLLAGHVFIVTGALLLSSTLIPAASSSPLMYGEALPWDDLQALRGASERLGWSLEIEFAKGAALNGDREASFVLRDRRGEPIRDAALQVGMFHHSRPRSPIEVVLPPDPLSDTRTASLSVNREGTWRVTAIASRGDDRFLAEDDVWVGKPEGARR